jgi:hypothetical protein
MKKYLKFLIILTIISILILSGCTETPQEIPINNNESNNTNDNLENEINETNTELYTEEEALEIVSRDKDWEEFNDIYPNFEGVLVRQEPLNVNSHADLENAWEYDKRLLNAIEFLIDYDFSANNYAFEFENKNDEDIGLYAVINSDTNEPLFIIALERMEFY